MTAAQASARDLRRAARIATVTALVVVASFVAGKAARDAILLSRFDVTRLPIFVGAASALSLPVVLLAGRLMARIGPGRLMPIGNAASAALLVVEWLMLARWPGPAAVAMFFHISAVGAVLVSGFWSIINERFDARTARRHIGRIGMGATLGGIAGGVIAERAAVLLSADKLLLVLAGLQLATAVALLTLGGGATRPVDAAAAGDRAGPALKLIARSGLLRNLALVVVLGAIAGTLLDFAFKARIAGSANGLLRSLAVYYTVTNLLTAVVQLALGGALIGRLGVPRSIAVLPLTVTAFGIAALAIPTMLATAVARGAEAVTRNSVYRAAYELLYAPLPEHHKRPTKVMLDVGAERVGDLIGSQLVGALVYLVAAPRLSLQVAAIVAGALALIAALRLPRSYRQALEHRLLLRAPSEPGPSHPAWASMTGPPVLSDAGDLTALSLLRIPTALPPRLAALDPKRPAEVDPIAARLADLRSGDVARVRRALGEPLGRELVPQAIALLAWRDAADAATAALTAIAPRATDLLVDGLLDPGNPFAVRRRLPGILAAGDPAPAIRGLWRGLGDPRFEVRYRCGAALARLAADPAYGVAAAAEVFAAVEREISIDLRVWQSHRLLDATGDDALQRVLARRSSTGLEHVFTLLGLVLPAEPLRIALQAIHADDPSLRGTALEYLESVLPGEIRARLWPFLEIELDGARAGGPLRSRAEIVAALELSHPSIRADLHALVQRAAAAEGPRPSLRDLHARAVIRPRKPLSRQRFNTDWTRPARIQRTSHSG